MDLGNRDTLHVKVVLRESFGIFVDPVLALHLVAVRREAWLI
jgi:hypothetical protein